ncbi:MAG: hypothetical protein RJA81_1378 [Planctomycetota bacterium]|jgi:hypothetical protein
MYGQLELNSQGGESDMSDRRTKERERVWGRRPVILRFDVGHPRMVEPEKRKQDQDSTTSFLASLFQSVIQTDHMVEAEKTKTQQPPQWYLVESDNTTALRKPIQREELQAVEETETAIEVADPEDPIHKPRQKSFWRLQSPHISLNVFPPKS